MAPHTPIVPPLGAAYSDPAVHAGAGEPSPAVESGGPATRTRARRNAGSAILPGPVAGPSGSWGGNSIGGGIGLEGGASGAVPALLPEAELVPVAHGRRGSLRAAGVGGAYASTLEGTGTYRETTDFAPSSPSSQASSRGDAEMQDVVGQYCSDFLPRITLTDLPAEILELICYDIEDKADLVSLCLVNRLLHEFASRALFREPKITSRHVAWKLRTATRARKGLVGQIKVLDLDLVDLCHASLWASWHLQETGGVILDIMRYCHHLIHFRCQMPSEAGMFWPDFSGTIGTSFRYLQTFYKDVRYGHDPFWDFEHYANTGAAWISMPDLLTCIASHALLHTVAVRGLGSALSGRPPYRGSLSLAGKLRTLVIVQTSLKERDLLLLMGGPGATSVTKLTLIESTCISKRGLVDALTTCGMALEELTIGPGWWGKSDTSFPIDDVALRLKHLRQLTVEGDIISPAFFGTTHSHPGHHVRLDSLVIRRCHLFRPEVTLRALRDMSRALLGAAGAGGSGGGRGGSGGGGGGSGGGGRGRGGTRPRTPSGAKRTLASAASTPTGSEAGAGGEAEAGAGAEAEAEAPAVKQFYMTHAVKNGWSVGDLREAMKLLHPGEMTHDLLEHGED